MSDPKSRLKYLNEDDGVYLECIEQEGDISGHWEQNLGFDASVIDAMMAWDRHLEKAHPDYVRKINE